MIKLDNLQSRYSFYCDENFPEPCVKFLKKRKFKAIHSNEVGNTRSTDGQQFTYAKKHSMILMTNDFDFVSFNKQYSLSKNSGIVIFNQALPHITNKLINKLIKHIKKTNIQLCGNITTVSVSQIVQHI